MTDNERNLYEKELIQILLTHPSYVVTLQVKPEYLSKKACKELKALLKLYEKDKKLSLTSIECDSSTLDNLVDSITDNSVVVLDPKIDFINIQIKLIEDYKRRSLKELSVKALDKKVKSKDWYEKLDEIRSIEYKNEAIYLGDKEISNNLRDSENLIHITKYPKLNYALKLCKGDLLVIGASSGSGKTSFMLNIQNILMHNYHCIYINIEMSEPTLIKRMISINTGLEFNMISKTISSEQNDFVLAGKDDIIKSKITLINGANTIEKIEEVIASNLEDKRHNVIFIDHLGLIQGTGRSIYERTTLNAQKLRILCLKYGVTIIVASQLSRAGQNQDEPDITSFKDSGEVENSSRKAIVMYPQDKSAMKDSLNYTPILNIDIVKNDTGMLMNIPMIFEKKTQRFKEM